MRSRQGPLKAAMLSVMAANRFTALPGERIKKVERAQARGQGALNLLQQRRLWLPFRYMRQILKAWPHPRILPAWACRGTRP